MTEAKARANRPVWLWAIGGLFLLIALGVAGIWLWRVPLASWAVQQACNGRELSCRFELEQVGFGGAELSALSVTTASGDTPVAAERLTLAVDWPGLFSPRLTGANLQAPKIRARFDGESIDLYGLETLFEGGGGAAPADWPHVTARNGAVFLDTPAGPLSGTFELDLDSRSDATAQLHIEPAELSTEDGHLQLGSALLDMKIEDGEPSGVADLEITDGAFGAFTARAVLLRAELLPTDEPEVDLLRYRLAARELDMAGYGVTAATSSGDIHLMLEAASGSFQPVEILSGLVAHLSADSVRTPDLTAGMLDLEVDLSRAGRGALEGELGLTADTATLDGILESASDLVLTGDARLEADGAARFDGRGTARAIHVAASWRDRIAGMLTLGGGLGAHGAALDAWVHAGLENVDTGLTFALRRAPEGALELRARGPVRLTAASGTVAVLRPFGETAGLVWDDGELTMRGTIAVEGGGGPDLSADLNELTYGPGGTQLHLADLVLAPWTEDGLTASADITRLDLSQAGTAMRTSVRGTLGLDGDLGAASVRGLTLFGAVDAARGPEGWRAQLAEGDCLALAADRTQIQSVRFGALATRLCPSDGRLVRQGANGPEGMLQADTLSVDFTSGDNQGRLHLPAPAVNWTANGGLTADLTSRGVRLDLSTGPRELSIAAGEAGLGLRLTERDGVRLSGGLDTVRFGGSLIPAQVSADAASFSFSGARGGTGELTGVRIADTREDPLYRPVVTHLAARLQSGELTMTGPVFLESTNRLIADAEVHLSFPEVDGEILVTGRDLDFRQGGLQISDLSDRLRGFFTNTRGSLEAEARVAISGGALHGTGDVTVSGFGFQTVALGRISGIDGAVHFDDLLALTTPPSQRVTIGSIDPGLPLRDGEVLFQLVGGGDAELQSALWPFAGGVLSVEPTLWELGATSRVITVRADHIGLKELTDLLEMPGFSAEGTVSGRFPIALEAGNAYIRNARLAADSTGGTLRYTGAVGQQAGQTNETVAMAFRALRDFRFTVLEIGADGNLADDIVLSARLQGHNPDVLNGQEFNFNVSIDSKLGQLLSSTRKLTGTDWLAEIRAQQSETDEGVSEGD